jgi:glutaredoxin-like protein NrdH
LTVDETALDKMKALGFQQAPVVVETDAEGNVVDSWSGFRPDKVEEKKALVAAELVAV